ncbi:MAG: pilus assembly protein [Firmicutes bacterium]|nr:pilus assembly protein [Bacillota bacterium]
MKKINFRKGQGIVEMVLVLPILLLVVMGIFEVGRVISVELTLNHYAREGVRLASLGKDDIDIIQDMNSHMTNLDNGSLNITINPSDSSRRSGDNVVVTVSYDVNIITPIISNVVGSNISLSGEFNGRVE